MLRIILVLAAIIALPIQAKKAKWECRTEGLIETCEFWLDPAKFDVTTVAAPTPQLQANWCWLASIEMAFKLYGYRMPQQKLLELLWGRIEDMPGRQEQIIAATNRVYTDETGKRFRAESIQLENWFAASLSLGQNAPVLVGYSQPGGVGHMTMIAGIQFQALYNLNNQIIDTRVSDVILWDPWPGVGIRRMTATEFDNVFLLVAVGATALPDVVAVRRRIAPPMTLEKLGRYNLLGRSIR